MGLFGMFLVHCPSPYNVLAMYWLGTLPLTPSVRCICSQGERSLRTTTSHPTLTFTATLGLSPRHYMFAVPTGAAVTQAPTPTLHLHPYTSTSTSTSTHPAIAHTTTALPDFKILQLPISSGSPRWTTFFIESEINTLQVRSLIP